MKQHFIQVQCYQTKNKAHAKAQKYVAKYDDCLIDDVEPGAFCLVVLPGGMPGSKNLAENERVHTLVRSVWDGGGHVAAICAAPDHRPLLTNSDTARPSAMPIKPVRRAVAGSPAPSAWPATCQRGWSRVGRTPRSAIIRSKVDK